MNLDNINSPDDLKNLSISDLNDLCYDIRSNLIDTVQKNGGHLASNLGMVEVTVALHKVFDCPKDTFVFDVGHQAYTHKILTGRYSDFSSLRTKNGLSGFTRPDESEYDSFISGHASTSISSAIGLARAKQLKGDNSKVVAIVGDGAFGGGMIYEAINNIDNSLKNLIVILNDNSMSISKTVGSLARYLMLLRTGTRYSKLKAKISYSLSRTGPGKKISNFIIRSKSHLRRSLYNGTLFEELGFNYVGPIDGHNIRQMLDIFENVKHMDGPLLVHVITKKGKGFLPAENNPGAYHGVSASSSSSEKPDDVDRNNPDIAASDSFSNEFGLAILEEAKKDSRIVAVTAAMKYATGLNYFYKEYPKRFFDVGIAEEHAVTFSGGLAKGGFLPVFAVYSTFMQRSFDQLIHDISIARLPLFLAIDRAGLVGEDGETHQGIFDIPELNTIGCFETYSPCNYNELKGIVKNLASKEYPRAIRYPRGKEPVSLSDMAYTGNEYDILTSESDLSIVTFGRETAECLSSAEKLRTDNIDVEIIKINRIIPFPQDLIKHLSNKKVILFAEESVYTGGIAETCLSALNKNGFKGSFMSVNVSADRVSPGSVSVQLCENKLDADSLTNCFKELLK